MEMSLELPTTVPKKNTGNNIFSSVLSMAFILLGVVVSIALKFKPSLVLHVPRYGYLLWALAFVGTIPPYYDSGCYMHKHSFEWLHNNDVIVSAAAKSGATWMLYCSHTIRSKRVSKEGFLPDFVDPNYNTPWPEFIQNPGDNWKNQLLGEYSKPPLKDYWDHPNYPFRIFKSHNGPHIFQHDHLIAPALDNSKGYYSGYKRNTFGRNNKIKVKFVAMVRNGLDQAESMVPFFQEQHKDDFISRWGGYPPKSSFTKLQDMMPGGTLEDLYFDYVNEWWDVRHHDNVLLLHYTDAIQDLNKTVSKLSKFYDIELTTEEQEDVVQKCSFKYMKEQQKGKFDYKLPALKGYDGSQTVFKSNSLLRKGTVGEGSKYFTEEEKETWKQWEETKFGVDEAKLRWARQGGDFE